MPFTSAIDSSSAKEPVLREDTISSASQSAPSIKQAEDSIDKVSLANRVNIEAQTSRAELPVPLYAYICDIMKACDSYRKMRQSHDQTYIEMRKNRDAYVTQQTQLYSEICQKQKEIANSVEQELEKLLPKIQDIVDGMRDAVISQNDCIDNLREGNTEEQKQYQNLDEAYRTYMDQLKALSAINDQGEVHPPTDPKDFKEYQAATQKYQKAVTKFNNYFEQRKQEISEFNAKSTAYNDLVQKYNQELHTILESSELSQYSSVFPFLDEVPLRDMSGLNDWSQQLKDLSSPPFILRPLTNRENSIAEYGAPSYSQIDLSSLDLFRSSSDEIIDVIGENVKQEIYRELSALSSFQYFLKEKEEKQEEHIEAYHESFVDSAKKSKSQSHSKASLSLEGVIMHDLLEGYDPQLHVLLGQQLIEKILKENSEKQLSETSLDKQEEAKRKASSELSKALPALSITILSSLVQESLLLGFNSLGTSPQNVSSDSSTANIAFNASLLQCALESHESTL